MSASLSDGTMPTASRTVWSLADESIRKLRVGVMAATGLSAALAVVLKLTADDGPTYPWDDTATLVWLLVATWCFISAALTCTRLQRTSEVVTILTAYTSSMAVVVSETPDYAVVIGVASFSLVVALPGVAFRISSPRASTYNILAVCTAFVASMLLRILIRADSGLTSAADITLKLVLPTTALAIQWFLVRALNRRILEALEESELARRAVRRALDRQVATNDALLKFVPQEFLTSLGRHELSDVQLGDSVTKTMSILFADILGYTRLAEGMPPGHTVPLLNDVFGALEPAIHAHGGFVDSYIGDAIMALFDGPAHNAIDAALAMQAALRAQNAVRRAAGQPEIAIGIGINTGPVTLGTVGGPKHFKCSVFGDSVNLAARVETLTRRYDTPLLVSAHTLEMVGDDHPHDARVVDRVRVVGRASSTTLYEIFDADPEPRRGDKRRIAADYSAGINAYYDRRFADALAAFERCREHHDDRVLRTYAERSRALIDNPPDPDWTGVEGLLQK